jgi:signal peptidase I
MIPTVLPGDHVFVRMWRFGAPSPRRGDLVVYQSPQDSSRLLFHRVVALPGDRVEVVAKRLRINGREVREPYAVHRDQRTYGSGEGPIALRDNLAPEVVPADRFFVLGDNRDNSYDSRFYGPVPRGNLLGGGEVMVYLSLDPETREVRWSRMGRRLR